MSILFSLIFFNVPHEWNTLPVFYRCRWDGLWLSCPAKPSEHGSHEDSTLLFHPSGPSPVVEGPTPLCRDSSFLLCDEFQQAAWPLLLLINVLGIVLMSSVGRLHPLLHRFHVSRVGETPNMFKTHHPPWICNPFSTAFTSCKTGYLIQIWHQARESCAQITSKYIKYLTIHRSWYLCGSWN